MSRCPTFTLSAVREHDVDVIAAPEIDITEGEEAGDLKFDAVVEIRPQVQIPGYGGLQVTLERPEATDEDIDRQVDRLRTNNAALEEVTRPAKDGDVLTIDLGMTPAEGEPNTLTDVSYTLGSNEFGVEELDVQLQGARIGDIIKFTASPAEGRSVSFQVLVKAVRMQVLPDVTDEWVTQESEFDTVQALRDDLRTRITAVKRVQAGLALRERAITALVDLVTDDPPAPLVDAEVERVLHDLGHRLEAQKATIDQFLQATGQEPQAFVDDLRAKAVPQVKADLALRALAEAEELEATEEDVDEEIARHGAGGRPLPGAGQAQSRQWRPTARGTLRPAEGQGARLAAGTCRRRGPRRKAHRPGRARAPAGRRQRRPSRGRECRRRTQTDATGLRLLRTERRGEHPPRRAGDGPLLPPPARAHHHPRHPDRRHHRQPGVRPAPLPPVRER